MAPQVPVEPETSSGSIEEAAAAASSVAVAMDTVTIVTDEEEVKQRQQQTRTTRSKAAAAAAKTEVANDEEDDAAPEKDEEKKDDKPPAPKKDYSNWPLKDIREPHAHDVMFGRGGRSFLLLLFLYKSGGTRVRVGSRSWTRSAANCLMFVFSRLLKVHNLD